MTQAAVLLVFLCLFPFVTVNAPLVSMSSLSTSALIQLLRFLAFLPVFLYVFPVSVTVVVQICHFICDHVKRAPTMPTCMQAKRLLTEVSVIDRQCKHKLLMFGFTEQHQRQSLVKV